MVVYALKNAVRTLQRIFHLIMSSQVVHYLRTHDSQELGPCSQVRIVETHISYILLNGQFAYKFKKSKSLGFLDFSTPMLRHEYIKKELKLNKVWAPDLYICIVAFWWDSFGNLLSSTDVSKSPKNSEWSLKMHQFNENSVFSCILSRGELSHNLITRLALKVADVHLKAETRIGWWNPVAVLGYCQQNFQQIRLLGVPSTVQLDELETWTMSFCRALEDTINNRSNSGFVRVCHGDLHLNNVVEHNGNVLAFDCIEFNPSFRNIDVQADIAFTLMDLEYNNEYELANGFLNTYLCLTGDYSGLQLLPFYKVYRAIIRAKVALFTRADHQECEPIYQKLTQTFEHYISLALEYTNTRVPSLVIMHGVSGSGKSYVARRVAPRINAIHLRSDIERKRLHALPFESHVVDEINLYSTDSNLATYTRLYDLSRELLSYGISVVVDATFLLEGQLDKFCDLATSIGCISCVVDCHAEDSVLTSRVESRLTQGSDPSDATTKVLEEQLESLNRTEHILSLGNNTPVVAIDTSAGVGAHLDRITHALH